LRGRDGGLSKLNAIGRLPGRTGDVETVRVLKDLDSKTRTQVEYAHEGAFIEAPLNGAKLKKGKGKKWIG
jgi:hypothetical protein